MAILISQDSIPSDDATPPPPPRTPVFVAWPTADQLAKTTPHTPLYPLPLLRIAIHDCVCYRNITKLGKLLIAGWSIDAWRRWLILLSAIGEYLRKVYSRFH